jgi:hypothetical protein
MGAVSGGERPEGEAATSVSGTRWQAAQRATDNTDANWYSSRAACELSLTHMMICAWCCAWRARSWCALVQNGGGLSAYIRSRYFKVSFGVGRGNILDTATETR